MKKLARSAELDVLRALAVLLVLLFHARNLQGLPSTLKSAFSVGWVGVDLFFVLSGFLVSGLLFKEFIRYGDLKPVRFLVRRGLKIYPAFYVFLGTTVAVTILRHEYWHRPFLYEAIFVQNYFRGFWSHTWSLAIEEHFYILLPVLLLTLLRFSRSNTDPFRLFPYCFVALATFCLVGRIVTVYFLHPKVWHEFYATYLPTHLRIDSLMAGVTLSYFYHFHREKLSGVSQKYSVLLWIMVCIGAFVVWAEPLETSRLMYTVGFSILYAAFGALLLLVVMWLPRRTNVVSEKLGLIAAIGSYSYSIYLWHVMVRDWGLPEFEKWHGGPAAVGLEFGIYLVVSIGWGILLSKLVEMPVLYFRDRKYPSRSGAVVFAAEPKMLANTGTERANALP